MARNFLIVVFCFVTYGPGWLVGRLVCLFVVFEELAVCLQSYWH
jgi:hypothetical protein